MQLGSHVFRKGKRVTKQKRMRKYEKLRKKEERGERERERRENDSERNEKESVERGRCKKQKIEASTTRFDAQFKSCSLARAEFF